MKTIDDEELTRFILQDLPAPRVIEIQTLIDTDEEFAARVEVNRFMIEAIAGFPPDFRPDDQTVLSRSVNKTFNFVARHRVLAITVLVSFIVATTATAGWLIINAPLLEDSLTTGWFNAKLWLPPPEEIKDGGLRAEKGYLRFVNRGYLRPRQEFPEGIDIQFEWKWIQLGLDPRYADHLSVAIRTNGMPNTRFFNEASDGLVVKLNAWGGYINIMDPDGSDLARTPSGRVPLPAEEWHHVRITDDGEIISVYVTGPLIQQPEDGKPLLEYRHPTSQGGRRFAIYNRELVSFPHESCVRNLTVRALGKR